MVTAETLHKRATRVLPEAIQTCGVLLADGEESAIAALLFPLRRKSSGSLLFRISPHTLASLSSNPAGYLTQATCARQGVGRHAKPFAYRAWRKAVLNFGRLDGGKRHPTEEHPPYVEVYFTMKTDGKALLVLIPEDRMLLYVWHD